MNKDKLNNKDCSSYNNDTQNKTKMHKHLQYGLS